VAERADGTPLSEPAAIAPLRRLFEQAPDAAAPARGEAPQVGNRPQPLGPPPAVYQGPDSGVLQWNGAAPPTGGPVYIFDGTQVGGLIGGDPLPGVPVNVSVLDNPEVRITEVPGPGNGNHRLTLQVPPNVTKPIRIRWQVLKGGRP
jgi:hypothetical protein